jgi:hypothetical protein
METISTHTHFDVASLLADSIDTILETAEEQVSMMM